VQVVDPFADAARRCAKYDRSTPAAEKLQKADAVVLAVGHAAFREITPEDCSA